MAEEVTLEFIARQQQQVLGELRIMQADLREIRDDVRVLTAMAVRQDNRAPRTLDLLHLTTSGCGRWRTRNDGR